MQPRLMDINEFIKKENIKQVSSIRRYSGNKIDESGLFSEEIFGRQGSQERRTKFGYINLKTKIIHPEAWSIVTRLSPDALRCIKGDTKYSINNKILIEDENGKTGLFFFISVLPKLDFDYYAKKDKKRESIVEYIKKNIKTVLIDKMIVLPAGIRDIRISTSSGKTFIESSEINTIYENLVRQSNSIATSVEDLPEDIVEPILTSMQRNCLEINNWIKNRIKGKQGLIRGGMFSKRTDYSGRLVVVSDPTLKMGYVGLPWQIVLILFEPFAINYILYKDKTGIPLIQEEMKIEDPPDITDVKRLLKKAKDNPADILPGLKDYLIEVAKEITKEKNVLYKRDPVENRDSWLAAYVRVDLDGHVIRLNPFDFPRTGGDYRVVSLQQ
jgi:DNA-directed RNA polymerase beta' subunit